MGVDIGYWIYQCKSLTMDALKTRTNIPIRHWCGDHSLCGSWYIKKEATEKGKTDHHKPLFDVNDNNAIMNRF